MIVYQLDDEGYFVNQTEADESPKEPGVYHIPGGCVKEAPPSIPEGKRAKYNNGTYSLEDIPPPKREPDPEPEPLSEFSIKEEAHKRIARATGARGTLETMADQLNMLMEEVIAMKKFMLKPANEVEEVKDKIDQVRAVVPELERTLPEDYKDDKHWPEFSRQV